jgi:hypothetical protein
MKSEDMQIGKTVSSFGRHPEYFEEGKIEYIGPDYVIVRVGSQYDPEYEKWALMVDECDYENLLEGTLNDNRA